MYKSLSRLYDLTCCLFFYDCKFSSSYALFSYQLEEEQGFKEFMSVHQNRSQAPTWANDVTEEMVDPKSEQAKSKKKPASDDYLNFDSEQSEDEEEESDDDEGWSIPGRGG